MNAPAAGHTRLVIVGATGMVGATPSVMRSKTQPSDL